MTHIVSCMGVHSKDQDGKPWSDAAQTRCEEIGIHHVNFVPSFRIRSAFVIRCGCAKEWVLI